MSAFLNLPTPDPSSLPPHLRALRDAALRQEPGSGFSTNIRPLRRRRLHRDHLSPPVSAVADNDDDDDDDDDDDRDNQTMLQGFEWHVPADGQHWARLRRVLPALAALGVTALWIPPATKAAAGAASNGYDAYDLYDLGEFAQKGEPTAATKWGPKHDLVALGRDAARRRVRLLFDAVLNHKAGADSVERVPARRVEERDRLRVKEEEEEEPGEEGGGDAAPPREIEAWTAFDFPARAGRYSTMRWRWEHFTGVDYDHARRERGVWKFEGKQWAEDVDEELGNYDFLMFADIDHSHPDVRNDLFHWVEWLSRQVELGGMRLDAVKHYSFRFLRDLVARIDARVDPDWFLVAEYWREDSEFLASFVEFMGHRIALFDVQLLSNFSRISLLEEKGDLREVLDDALFLWKPQNAVTFVVNHDTQPGQPLEAPIAPFFIPLAYALILLRANAGIPCVFYADLFGYVRHPPNPGSIISTTPPTSGGAVLPKMMLARKLWAYGPQHDYFDDPRCVGFTRSGRRSKSAGDGLAVLMTNAWEYATKRMFVGERHAGEVWTDLLRWCPGQVVIGPDGWGLFSVGPRSVAVWVNAEAAGREMVDSFVFDYDIYGLSSKGETASSAM